MTSSSFSMKKRESTFTRVILGGTLLWVQRTASLSRVRRTSSMWRTSYCALLRILCAVRSCKPYCMTKRWARWLWRVICWTWCSSARNGRKDAITFWRLWCRGSFWRRCPCLHDVINVFVFWDCMFSVVILGVLSIGRAFIKKNVAVRRLTQFGIFLNASSLAFTLGFLRSSRDMLKLKDCPLLTGKKDFRVNLRNNSIRVRVRAKSNFQRQSWLQLERKAIIRENPHQN